MMRVVLDGVGLILIVLGIVIFPLPIPLGLLLVAVGLTILMISERVVRTWAQHMRKKNPNINKMFHFCARCVPKSIANVIRETDPHV